MHVTCFCPVSDRILASFNYIGNKIGGWCRATDESGPANKLSPADKPSLTNNVPKIPAAVAAENVYQEVVDIVRRPAADNVYQEVVDTIPRPALPRRSRQRPLDVSSRHITDMFGRARADQNIYDGMENLVCRMIDFENGVPLRSLETFIDVYTGIDLISWIMNYMNIGEVDAMYLANLLASLGFLYPIDDRTLKVKNDGGFYRFQSPYYWKSGIADGSDQDYAAYLTRRLIYSSYNMYEPFTKHEAIAFEKLKKSLSSIWSRIEAQAIEDINFTEKYCEVEKNLIFSEQRAFWDLRRPKSGAHVRKQFEYKRLLMFRPYLEIEELVFPLRFPKKPTPRTLKFQNSVVLFANYTH